MSFCLGLSARRSFAALLTFILMIVGAPWAHAQLDRANLTENQRHFLNAYDAIKANDRPQIAHYKSILQNYALYPYILYLDYKYHFDQTPESLIAQFFTTYPDHTLTPFLKSRYLTYLGQHNKTRQFLKYYDAKSHHSLSLQCYYIDAQSRVGQEKLVRELAQQLWAEHTRLTGACGFINHYLRKKKLITGSMVWSRLTLAMDKGHINQAKRIARDLSQTDQKTYRYWLSVYKDPKKVLSDFPAYLPPVIRKSIFMQGARRLAYSKPNQALDALKLRAEQYGLSDEEKQSLEQTISLRFAYRFHPQASEYLSRLDEAAQNEKVMNWRLQLTIRESDWLQYLDLYDLLSDEQKEDKRWRYWKARALEELNQPNKATQIFRELAKERNFYGFLAADKLEQPYRFNPAPKKEYDLKTLTKKYPELNVIQELIAIDWNFSMRREWYHLLQTIDRNDIEAIATFMADWQQHNLAIQTVAKAKKWDDLSLRFPTPYKQPIMKSAQKHTIDPAWVYGVIRRESAFSSNIRSPVGAVGLMQLMPQTARYIGRKIGFKRRQYTALTNAESNIELGSAYLSYLHKKYNGNRVLATAAYNAGPHRVDAWIPKNRVIAADQWIDSIPFNETRAYVKAVMEYTTIFKSVLNNDYDRLENFMEPIGQLSDKAQGESTLPAHPHLASNRHSQ